MSYSNLDPSSIARDVHIEADHAIRTVIDSGTVSISGTVTTTSTAGGLAAIEPPQYLAAASIPAYSSAYLELVASTSADIKQLQLFDTTGVFLVIGVGAAGFEVEEILAGPGIDGGIPCDIPSGSRIAIKTREAVAPVAGNTAINFLG